MLVAWHSTRWWDWFAPKDRKKNYFLLMRSSKIFSIVSAKINGLMNYQLLNGAEA